MSDPVHDPRIAAAAGVVRARLGSEPFALALVAGTGLGPLAGRLTEAVALPYGEIPHFPVSGVSGHAGRLVAGRLAGRRVLLFQGRAHAYEHGDAAAMRVPVGLVAASARRRSSSPTPPARSCPRPAPAASPSSPTTSTSRG